MYSLSHVVDHPMSSPCCVAKAGPVLAYRIMYLNVVFVDRRSCTTSEITMIRTYGHVTGDMIWWYVGCCVVCGTSGTSMLCSIPILLYLSLGNAH